METTTIGAKELLEQVVVKKSHIWTHGSLSQKLLKQSAANIQALYRDRGYEEVKVAASVVDHEPKIDVDFDIQEGVQTIVADVQVSGNENVPGCRNSPRQKDSSCVPVCRTRREKLTEDRNRISATYLNRGYLNAEAKARVQPEAGRRTSR